MFSENWNGLQTHEPTLFEDLFAQAAQNFPPNDEKITDRMDFFRMTPMSPFSSSSGSSFTRSTCSPDIWPESDDSVSDVDPQFEESGSPTEDTEIQLKVEHCDSPFLPPVHLSAADINSDILLSTHMKLRESASPSPPPFIPSSPPSWRLARRSLSVASTSADPDYDVHSESDGNASDDEYIPSPTLGSRKRCRSPPGLRETPKRLTQSVEHRSTKRARQAPPSRNAQAISPATVRAALAAAKNQADLTCIACHWTQTNGRIPDFKRHLKTHLRADDRDQTQGWWCKGVPLRDAARYGLPKNLRPFLFGDQWRVGGCERTFSRRDALKRHLDNENVACVGRPCDASEN